MFIGIAGPRSAGKQAVAKWLISNHEFVLVSLRDDGHVVKDEDGVFKTAKDLLDYVTKNWEKNFVTCNVETTEILETYSIRPFFLLLAIDGPVLIRYGRYKLLSQKENYPEKTLEEFVKDDDVCLFEAFVSSNKNEQETSKSPESKNSSSSSVYDVMTRADLTIVNSYSTLPELHLYLKGLELTNKERLRPSWEDYFMYLSDLAALRSNCMKRRVGCILVKDHRVIATGYNGTPRGLKNCNEGGCERCNNAAPCGTNLETCRCLHAEENALLEAGKERIGEGCIVYCNTCPCLGCTIKLIQMGVKEVIYKNTYGTDEATGRLFASAGIKLRKHVPPKRNL